MCSRYHLDFDLKKKLSAVRGYRDFPEGDFSPGSLAPVLLDGKDGWELSFMRWGFRAGDAAGLVFNGRAESVEERPLFCDSFQFRRCVIPAAWFYEWNRSKEKIKFAGKAGARGLSLAGIWRPEKEGAAFTVLTTEANGSMRPVHDRMPLLLRDRELSDWCLDFKRSREILGEVPEELDRSADYEQLTMFFE